MLSVFHTQRQNVKAFKRVQVFKSVMKKTLKSTIYLPTGGPRSSGRKNTVVHRSEAKRGNSLARLARVSRQKEKTETALQKSLTICLFFLFFSARHTGPREGPLLLRGIPLPRQRLQFRPFLDASASHLQTTQKCRLSVGSPIISSTLGT